MKLFDDIKQIFTDECVIDGTSYTDKGVTVSIQQKPPEDIIFCKIDGCLINDTLTKKADLFIAYSKTSETRFIFVCELKGRHTERAFKQIIETLEDSRFKRVLSLIPKNYKKIAIIASGAKRKKLLQKYKEELKQKFGFKSEVKTVTNKGLLDLRPIITRNIK